jgi:hypothetical protein
MKATYSKEDDLFRLGGRQVYWSSIYVLRQEKTTPQALFKQLKVSAKERPMFLEELDDLRALGFIRGKDAITTTPKGKAFLDEVERLVSFKGLRNRAVHDIDEVFAEESALERMNPAKTSSLVAHRAEHGERVDWGAFFFNSLIGYWVFLILTLVFMQALSPMPLRALLVEFLLSPVAAVFGIGVLSAFLYIAYNVGAYINRSLFAGI